MQTFNDKDLGKWLFGWFFQWYTPRFDAFSFALRRQQEYEADRAAAQASGASEAAEALVSVNLKGNYVEQKFWPSIYEKAAVQTSPVNAFSTLSSALVEPLPRDEAAKWLRRSLREETGFSDTHPALPDRLRALGYPTPTDESALEALQDRLSAPPAPNAAEYYFGDQLAPLTARLDEEWTSGVEEKSKSDELTDEELWDRARLTAEFRTNAEALPFFRALYERDPSNPKYAFVLGMTLLEEEQEEGVRLVEEAMAREPALSTPGSAAIREYLIVTERREEAKRYEKQAYDSMERDMLAEQERSGVTAGDKFLPHGLAPEEVERLRQEFEPIEKVAEAYLVRKQVQHFPDRPFYVFLLAPNNSWFTIRATANHGEMVEAVAEGVKPPGQSMCVVISSETGGIAKKIKKVPNSLIFKRS
jgi:hypothetical protein